MNVLGKIFESKKSFRLTLLYMAAPLISDKNFLKKKYRICMGKELNLENPMTYNEKIQWLKLYDRKPKYTEMVDKVDAKKYVTSVLGGDEHIIKTLAVYDKAEDIDFDALPERFVLKVAHDSGGLVICKNKSELDRETTIQFLKKRQKRDFYLFNREWPYKNVKHRILCEEYMEDASGELCDYKFFCFNGQPKVMFIASDRSKKSVQTKFDFFDMDFNHLDFRNGHPNASTLPERPVCFEEMKSLAAKLSKDIPHLRVDFYEVDGRVYFGELTFSHWSGMVPFEPEKWDKILGDYIDLPKQKDE